MSVRAITSESPSPVVCSDRSSNEHRRQRSHAPLRSVRSTPVAMAATTLALFVAGCGSSGHGSTSAASKPAPNRSDVSFLGTFMAELHTECSYVTISGTSTLQPQITRVIAMYRSLNPNASFVIQAGAGPTTLRNLVQTGIIPALDQTNAFNKPICAPVLGAQLARATG